MKFQEILLKQYDWQDEEIVIILKDQDSGLQTLPEDIQTEAKLQLEDVEFKADQTYLESFVMRRNGKKQRLYLLKLKSEISSRVIRAAMRQVENALRKYKAERPCIVFGSSFCARGIESLLTQLVVALYRFEEHTGHGGFMPNEKNELPEREAAYAVEEIKVVHAADESISEVISGALKLGEAISLSRHLVNQPANFMTPDLLAEAVKQAGRDFGFEVEVKDEKEIQELGMDAFWSVAKGSENPPRLIIMRYLNHPSCQEKIALVGKGVCYDSGGYAIKPADGMVTMHADMGGAGAVIGAISALAANRAEVNVVAIVAACENMISGGAMRNGDIIGSLAGKTIEVVNTDAEGRLTLADAVCYAQRFEGASKIIDIATLTGACVVALGNEITGVISNDDEIFKALELGAERSGDKIWRMPNDDDYAELNKTERADIKNSGGRWGGMITAGLFVRAFTGGLPWAHLDIAGPAYLSAQSDQYSAGASGVGAHLLYTAVQELCH